MVHSASQPAGVLTRLEVDRLRLADVDAAGQAHADSRAAVGRGIALDRQRRAVGPRDLRHLPALGNGEAKLEQAFGLRREGEAAGAA